MKPRPDLNTLSKEVYEANKLNGFHNKEHSNETCLMLVITELSEAVEADRKGKRADYIKYQSYLDAKGYTDMDIAFENCYKDTVEDDLADAVIRLLDLAGLRGIKFNLHIYNDDSTKCIEEETFSETIYQVCRLLFRQGICNPDDEDTKSIIHDAISEIEALSEYLSINLWLHVELKLKYNQSRPYNGKAY